MFGTRFGICIYFKEDILINKLKEFVTKKNEDVNEFCKSEHEYSNLISADKLPQEGVPYLADINKLIELSNITISAGDKDSEVNLKDVVKLAFVLGEIHGFCATEVKEVVESNAFKEHLKSSKHLIQTK